MYIFSINRFIAKMAKIMTRKTMHHALFGQAGPIPSDKLPLKGDVLKNVWRYKCMDGKFATVNSIVKKAAEDVSQLWEKAIGDRLTVPLLPQKNIEEKLRKLYNKGLEVNRSKSAAKVAAFQDEMNELFDICSCSCAPASCHDVKCKITNCDGFHLACNCKNKVPKREIQFLLDQRGSRRMVITGVDINVTRMWERAAAREEVEAKKARKETMRQEEMQDLQADLQILDENATDVEEEDTAPADRDTDYVPDSLVDKGKNNMTRLPNLAAVCDRYCVSNYAGAAIASAVLTDYGLITAFDKSQVIGPQKLADERRRYRNERRENELASLNNISALYFDGKKTITRMLLRNEKTGKWSSRMEVEDHYVILLEPGSQYFTHVTPQSGHGKLIAKAIYDFLVEQQLTGQPIMVAGCDGCRVNTGPNNGAVHHLELMLGKPLHYAVCQLHGNELPFRAIFYHYDGKPSGPEHWRGPIGKQIKESVSNLPVVQFQPISYPDHLVLTEEEVAEFSWDQKYMARMWLAVISGMVDDNLAAIEPGPPCISRWLTLWGRILRIYVATPRPNKELKRMVNMIVKFSVPMWFHIKRHPYAAAGPHNTFMGLQLMKNLNSEEKKIVKEAVQRNAYFAHPDQLILAMCADKDETVRHKAVGMIKQLRGNSKLTEVTQKSKDDSDMEEDDDTDPNGAVDEELLIRTDDEENEENSEISNEIPAPISGNVRKVVLPKIKFQAKSYHTMINWETELKSEPPYIAALTNEQLISILDTPLDVPKWPNHTQAVERGIKLLTEACTEVTGQRERDGYIRQRLFSRQLMPSFKTKGHFNFNY
jgi:hypothetical protein